MKLSKKNWKALASLPVGSYQAIGTRRGDITLRCEKSDGCHGCFGDSYCTGDSVCLPCEGCDRADNEYVIFVQEETLP